jgi:hypothetical protein
VKRVLFLGVVWRGVLLRIGGRRSKKAYFWGRVAAKHISGKRGDPRNLRVNDDWRS